jgi:hypothetical protein
MSTKTVELLHLVETCFEVLLIGNITTDRKGIRVIVLYDAMPAYLNPPPRRVGMAETNGRWYNVTRVLRYPLPANEFYVIWMYQDCTRLADQQVRLVVKNCLKPRAGIDIRSHD